MERPASSAPLNNAMGQASPMSHESMHQRAGNGMPRHEKHYAACTPEH